MRLLAPCCLASAALALTACGDGVGSSTDPAPTPTDLPRNVVVFSPDELADSDALFDGEATWTPTGADVRRADAALRRQVARTPGVTTPYVAHVRQVAGLDDDVVLVNAFCDGDSFDWRDSWSTVLDGGACFWQAAVRDGVVVSFSVNGEA